MKLQKNLLKRLESRQNLWKTSNSFSGYFPNMKVENKPAKDALAL